MICECPPYFYCRRSPLISRTFFFDELFYVVKDCFDFGVFLNIIWFQTESFFHFQLQLFSGRHRVHFVDVISKMGKDVEDIFVYVGSRLSFGVDIFCL